MESPGNSPPLEIRHKAQQSHDSGAYLDWSSEDSGSPTHGSDSMFNVSGEFVTVVSIGSGEDDSGGRGDEPYDGSTSVQVSDVPFVTVLSIGTPNNRDDDEKTVSLNISDVASTTVKVDDVDKVEEVIVYRLPGERLGFGLKFEGGTKSAENVKRLFIQSCAPDSPASRAQCSWGHLLEGDEVLEIDGDPVNTMTRIDCVRCLKESHVVIKLIVRHSLTAVTHHRPSDNETNVATDARKKLGLDLKATKSMPLASNDQLFSPLSPAKSTGDLPLVISAEMKKTLPVMPPPIPPRKVPRKPVTSPVNQLSNSIVGPPSDFCDADFSQQSPRAAVRTSLQHDASLGRDPEHRSAPTTPRVRQRLPPASPRIEARRSHQSSPEVARHFAKRLPGFNMSAVPPEAEVYLDLLALEEMNRLRHESESDDTGSSMSTVVDRLSTTNSSFSDLRSSASSTCGTTTPSTPTSTTTPAIDMAKVLGPFEQLEKEFAGSNGIDHEFLLTKLVASEASFIESRQKSTAVSAEEVATLLAQSGRPNDDDPVPLQPPPNFQDRDELSLMKKSPVNYNNVSKNQVKLNDDVIQLKSETQQPSGDSTEVFAVPALPPKPVQRKTSPPSGRFRSGKKRPPPPPPPTNDRPKCPQPAPPGAAVDNSAPMVDVDLTPTTPPLVNECSGPEIIERYPLGGNIIHRLIDHKTTDVTETSRTDKKEVESSDDDDERFNEEDGELISIDYSVLDQNEDISIVVPQLMHGGICIMSAADLQDIPVVAVTSDFGKCHVTDTAGELEVDEARILEEDELESVEFQITAVTSGSDVFFPYHWSGTTHLATIGEDDEYEASQTEALQRSSSGCVSAGLAVAVGSAAPRDAGEPAELLGSPTIECNNSKLANNDATMGDVNDDESKFEVPSSSINEAIDRQGIQLVRLQDLPTESSLASRKRVEHLPKEQEKKKNGDDVDEKVKQPPVIVVQLDEPEDKGADPAPPKTEVATEVITPEEAADKGVRGAMDALLALDTLTSSTPSIAKKQPYLSSTSDTSSLSPPPSFSRLPPDGHEFPTNYQEPNHFNVGVPALIEMDLNLEKLTVDSMLMKPCNDMPPPPLPSSIPPQKKASFQQEYTPPLPPSRQSNTASTEEGQTRSRPASWRTDQKSEQSVRDKIAMFASQKDNATPQVAQVSSTRRLSNTFKSSENIFYEEDTVDCSYGSLPSGKLLSRSVVSVDKVGQSQSSPAYRQPASSPVATTYKKDFSSFGSTGDVAVNTMTGHEESPRSLDYNPTRTLSSMDLLSSSSSAYSSCSPDSSLSSTSSYPVGYSSTLPRNLSNGRPTPALTSYGTTPRKSSAIETSRTSNSTATNGNALHTRSQSLVDVAARPTRHSIGHDASRASAEDMRRASLNALIEQRKRGMSKLRGLVIPEKVAEVAPSNQCVFDLPEIKSRESILATKPPLLTKDDTRYITDRQNTQNIGWSSTNNSYPSLEKKTTLTSTGSTNLSSPPWKYQAPVSNLPKYSPAFKRKSLAVCGSSSTASSVSSSLNSSREELRPCFEGNNGKPSMPPPPPMKPPRNPTTITNHLPSRQSIPVNYNSQFLYNPDPSKSLESITSPTRSDSSFEYIRITSPEQRINKNDVIKNNCTMLNDIHKKVLLSPSNKSMSDRGRSGEDDSDNDSAVSSSRSSISHDFSPPQSPLPDNQSRDSQHHTTRQNILLSPLPSSGNGSERRPLRRTLSSETTASAASSTASTLTSGSQASCSSNGGSSSDNGRRVLKAQSVEAINRKNVLSSARYSSGRDLKVASPLIKRKFEDEEERSDGDERDDEDVTLQDDCDVDHCNGDGSIETKDVMFYSSYTQDEINENGVRVAYLDIVTSEDGYEGQEDIDNEVVISNGEYTELGMVDIPAIPVAAPRRSNNSTSEDVECFKIESKIVTAKPESVPKIVSAEPQKRSYSTEAKVVQTATIEKKHHNGDDFVKVPKRNGHDTNSSEEPIVPSKPLSRKNSNNIQRDATVISACDKDLMNLLASPQRIQRQKSKEDVVKTSVKIPEVISPPSSTRIPATSARSTTNRRSVSVNDIRKAFEKAELALNNRASNGNAKPMNGNGVFNNHARVSSLDSTTSEDSCAMPPAHYGSVTNLQREQFGSITSLASSTSLISQQELQVLIDEANQALEEQGGGCPPVHEVLVVILHRELTGGSVGITLAGGADYEAKEITVHKVLGGSAADRDGRIQKGDRILSINGKSMKGVTHRESLNILKAPRTEVIFVISRPRGDSTDGPAVSSRPPRILEQPQEGSASSGSESESVNQIARGPPVTITLLKEGAGLGFSLEGGKDSPLGDKPLVIKKLFMGGIADKCGEIRAGDELLKVNELDITSMSRIEAWGLMKKLPDGKVLLTVRHKVENKSR